MDFLTPVFGETGARIVIIALVLLLLGALTMLLIGMAVRAFNGRFSFLRRSRSRAPRLAVPDTLTVDSRRKLILVRRDNVEHLLLVGGSTDIVIEPSIQRYTANARARQPARPDAASPQPAASPTGTNGTARPLAARSQQAVQAGYPAGETRPTPLPRAGLEPAAGAGATRAQERANPMTQAEDSNASAARPRPAPAVIVRPTAATEAGPPPSRDARPGATAARPSSLQQTAARPATADRPAQAAAPASRPAPEPAPAPRAPLPGATASEEGRRPTAPSARPAASRPTAAAQPPPGHPSNAPPSAEPPARQAGPSQPLPAAGPNEGQPPQKRGSRKDGDPDMTALLGEIFGQNKH